MQQQPHWQGQHAWPQQPQRQGQGDVWQPWQGQPWQGQWQQARSVEPTPEGEEAGRYLHYFVIPLSRIDDKEIVIADIPGLIEGAHQGVGLGDKFLKHIERCKSILHLIDINEENLFSRYKIIREELEKYSPELMNKREIVTLNKTKLLDKNEISTKTRDFEKNFKEKFFKISILKKNNIKELLRELK